MHRWVYATMVWVEASMIKRETERATGHLARVEQIVIAYDGVHKAITAECPSDFLAHRNPARSSTCIITPDNSFNSQAFRHKQAGNNAAENDACLHETIRRRECG